MQEWTDAQWQTLCIMMRVRMAEEYKKYGFGYDVSGQLRKQPYIDVVVKEATVDVDFYERD